MRYFILITILLVSHAVSAFPIPNGQYLLEHCSHAVQYTDGNIHEIYNKDTSSIISLGYCVGFINGINSSETFLYDNSVMAQESMRYIFPQYCLPNNSTMHQQVLVLLKYLRENPNLLHQSAVKIVINAFTEAFPCKMINK